MQIKTTIRLSPQTCQNGYHQKEDEQQELARMWRKGNFVHCWWDFKLMQPLWKQYGNLPQN